MEQQFGGSWTDRKLQCVGKYLRAYATLMRKQAFRFAYIDAFAGTGYRKRKRRVDDLQMTFPELAEEDTRHFVKGSARVALETTPHFDKYIFIEKSAERCAELERLRQEFPHLDESILVVQADANAALLDRCDKPWSRHRAVVFLDPYGMEVRWETVQALAHTNGVDLWYLFPLGVAVNRLLKKDGSIDEAIAHRLDELFRTHDWYKAFYETGTLHELFGERTVRLKAADFRAISIYFVERLATEFPGVAPNPLPLFNSKNIPLYLLCFASANKAGSPIALKIAQHILGST